MKELPQLNDVISESFLPNSPSTSEIIAIEQNLNQHIWHRRRKFVSFNQEVRFKRL